MKTVTGLFDDYADARAAVSALEDRGVPSDDISIVSNNVSDRYGTGNDSNAAEGAGTGAGVGAAIGGVGGLLTGLGVMAIPGVGPVVAAGWLAATAAGAAAGAVAGGAAGGIIGAMTESGVPEEYALSMLRECAAAAPSSPPVSITRSTRMRKPFCAEAAGSIRSSAAPPIPNRAGRNLTRRAIPTRPRRSRRSVCVSRACAKPAPPILGIGPDGAVSFGDRREPQSLSIATIVFASGVFLGLEPITSPSRRPLLRGSIAAGLLQPVTPGK